MAMDFFLYLIVSLLIGAAIFQITFKLLPKKLYAQTKSQNKEIVAEAHRQAQDLKADRLSQAKESLALNIEEMEADLKESRENHELELSDLETQEQSFESDFQRVEKLTDEIQTRTGRIDSLKEDLSSRQSDLDKEDERVNIELANYVDIDAKQKVTALANSMVTARQLECQKLLKTLQEDVSSSARKMAMRLLDRSHARYAPHFPWPKAINVVEVPDMHAFEKLQGEENDFINAAKELTGVDISPVDPSENRGLALARFSGGFGINKEALKTAFGQALSNKSLSFQVVAELYEKNRRTLEKQAAELGKQAVNILELPNIHPEIQRLIGSLNWRTSYRQNQWHHTVEVAQLAGILGNELGEDPAASKRVGLLHDIGKAIDYRIEGSHAVISGDYADRYGESRLICDTVMSHHADLIVESPLAWILQSADTLSGARPGARVNLEEGYQIRLGAIAEAVRSFKGIQDLAIMNGGREVHVQVHHEKVREDAINQLAGSIAKKIEEDVAFPGQIKIIVSRSFESTSVA